MNVSPYFYLKPPYIDLSWNFWDYKNNLSTSFTFLGAVLYRNLLLEVFESLSFLPSKFSRTKSIVPLLLLLRSKQNCVLKPLSLNWSNGKLLSFFVSEIIEISTLLLTNSAKNSNLFLSELIFKRAKISLLACFMRMKFSSIKINLHFSTTKFPLSLPSISSQSKISEKALTKFLLKIEVPDLLRCNLILLVFLGRNVFVCSLKKVSFSIQNCFKYTFTSMALSLNLSLRSMMFEILTVWKLPFIVIAKSIGDLAMRSGALSPYYKLLVPKCKIWSRIGLLMIPQLQAERAQLNSHYKLLWSHTINTTNAYFRKPIVFFICFNANFKHFIFVKKIKIFF